MHNSQISLFRSSLQQTFIEHFICNMDAGKKAECTPPQASTFLFSSGRGGQNRASPPQRRLDLGSDCTFCVEKMQFGALLTEMCVISQPILWVGCVLPRKFFHLCVENMQFDASKQCKQNSGQEKNLHFQDCICLGATLQLSLLSGIIRSHGSKAQAPMQPSLNLSPLYPFPCWAAIYAPSAVLGRDESHNSYWCI